MSDADLLPRRIIKETQRLLSEPVTGISATPYQDNLRHFNVIISGPGSSPYEGGIFKLELFLPEEYPMAPPKVRFMTKIYHPNIDRLGRICLDILKDKWSPALQIRTVLLSIQALLSAPNPDDPLANDVAEHWKRDEPEAKRQQRSGPNITPASMSMRVLLPDEIWLTTSAPISMRVRMIHTGSCFMWMAAHPWDTTEALYTGEQTAVPFEYSWAPVRVSRQLLGAEP
eukprot:CAMPEP_0183340330 /NCGR_PEP_ID=MMETSP0164_2-20130417/6915_1 /TAXON_ID=221442 /ORGANISM="Coccolithus pelagicus ssp braarudi, Strain PLY182g" /LENGTH=227 /DNA_ID=CAMNT_0025510447 /DNA_START=15 /DNA_END=699 /DNA_ORIENTATION=-